MASDHSRPKADGHESRQQILQRILEKRGVARKVSVGAGRESQLDVQHVDDIPDSAWQIDKFPMYKQLRLQQDAADRLGISSPYFLINDGISSNTTRINGSVVANFSGYNYIGLNGHPRVIAAAAEAAERWGTSASASRIVSGEKPPHRELEGRLAALHGTEAAVAFVSGYVTNVTAIAALVGPADLVIHDRLVHNSVVQGARLSSATRYAVPHNDVEALDTYLSENRKRFERVLIVTEGLFSMDGDICPLDRLVEIKRRHKALLMVDEAHSIGTLGASGRGVGEYFDLSGAQTVDIWMGTLSKTFAGCGGYIAGSSALIDLLKFTANGFVYSVGMPPPMAAASSEAVAILLEEPERVLRLQHNGQRFLRVAQAAGLDTGLAAGYNIVPVITGQSLAAGRLANTLLGRGFSVQPIGYPAVEERAARLRFFVTSEHTEDQIASAIAATSEEIKRLQLEPPR